MAIVDFRRLICYIYKLLSYACLKVSSFLCRIVLLFKLYCLNIPHGRIHTGGGIMRIRVSRKGKVLLGDNIDFANRWEVGYPLTCYIRVGGNGILRIGSNVGINSSSIFCDNSITIGNNVLIGGGCQIFDTNFHNINYIERRNPDTNGISKTAPIVIEDDVFIGGHCIIQKGVRVGARSIVAAGSVVIKSIPSDELWGGNPAKFIKKINYDV